MPSKDSVRSFWRAVPRRLLWIAAFGLLVPAWWLDRAPPGPQVIALPPLTQDVSLEIHSIGELATAKEWNELVGAVIFSRPGDDDERASFRNPLVPPILPCDHPALLEEDGSRGHIALGDRLVWAEESLPLPALVAPRSTQRFLRVLAAELRRAAMGDSTAPREVGLSDREAADRRKLEPRLARPVKLRHAQTPLSKVVADILDQAGLVLGDSDLVGDADEKVDVQLQAVSAATALRLILAEHQAFFATWQGKVEVHFGWRYYQPKGALRIYPVADILEATHGTVDDLAERSKLPRQFQTVLQWRTDLGYCRVQGLGDCVLMAGDDRRHEDFAALLRQTRAMLRQEDLAADPASVLERRITLHVEGLKMREAINLLGRENDLPLWLGRGAVVEDRNVSLHIRNTPAKEVLRLLAPGISIEADGEALSLHCFRRQVARPVCVIPLGHLKGIDKDPAALESLLVFLEGASGTGAAGGGFGTFGGSRDSRPGANVTFAPGGMYLQQINDDDGFDRAALLGPRTSFSRAVEAALLGPDEGRIDRMLAMLEVADLWGTTFLIRELARRRAEPAVAAAPVARALAREAMNRRNVLFRDDLLEDLLALGISAEERSDFLARNFRFHRRGESGRFLSLPPGYLTTEGLTKSFEKSDEKGKRVVLEMIKHFVVIGAEVPGETRWLERAIADKTIPATLEERAREILFYWQSNIGQ